MNLAEWRVWMERHGEPELRAMLLYAWDPIGVAGVVQAANEYDGYVLPLLRKLREGATAAEVTAYLDGVERERMGLSPSATQNVEVVRRIKRYENSTSGFEV